MVIIPLYINKSEQNLLIYSHCSWEILLSNQVRRISKLSKMLRYINQEILKVLKSQQFKSFSTNVLLVGKDLLRAFFTLFCLQFSNSGD